MHKLKNFLEELQNSGPERKKRWLIGGTAAAMAVVLALWLVYMSQVVEDLGASEEDSQSSFTAVFSNGFRIVQEELVSKVKNFMGETKSLDILPGLNFASTSSENAAAENSVQADPQNTGN